MAHPQENSDVTDKLLQSARDGDGTALNRLLGRYRADMRQMVELRMDRQLRRRVDPSDIVQEAKVEATRRFPEYLARPVMPFGLWMRQLTYERFLMMRRRHLDARRRAVGRELPLPENTSFALARMLVDDRPTPGQEAAAQERAQRVREAIARLPEIDREILLMRHFEGLANQEVAEVLKIDPVAASKRHGRALLRLQRLLEEGGMTGSQP